LNEMKNGKAILRDRRRSSPWRNISYNSVILAMGNYFVDVPGHDAASPDVLPLV
jgi:hypothetical protein